MKLYFNDSHTFDGFATDSNEEISKFYQTSLYFLKVIITCMFIFNWIILDFYGITF